MKLSEIAQSAKQAINQHAPEILTGIGIAGMVTTTVLAVKATPKAAQILEERKEDLQVEKLPVKEVVKSTWKLYIPAVVTGAASIACVVGSNVISGKRTALFATAYKVAEATHKQYREKVIETIGEKKEKQIQDSIAQDNVNKNPVTDGSVIITGKGETLCYDTYSGRYFKSDMNAIERAINELNYQMTHNEPYISLNEFYSMIGLQDTQLGDDLGWNIKNGLIEIRISSVISSDGKPALAINYDVMPETNYYKIR